MHLKSILLLACYLALTLAAGQQGAIKSAQRGPATAAAAAATDTKNRPGEIKRLAPVNNAQNVKTQQVQPARQQQQQQQLPAETKTKQKNINQAKPATGGIKTTSKFQSRILRSVQGQTSAAMGSQQQPGAGEQRHFGASSLDAWNPHNLMPTFSDQEQGDDMIALASENEPAMMGDGGGEQQQPTQQVKVLPQVNKSAGLMNGGYRGPSEQEMLGEKELSSSQAVGPASKQRQAQAVDDYYTDEDEEDEDSPSTMPSSSYKKSRQNNGYQLEEQNSQTDKVAELGRAQQQQLANNKSDLIPTSVREGGAWLPTAPVAPQQASQSEANSTQPKSSIRRPAGTDRLAGLFGGRESISSSLSKTDMAIEYLKNILKSKQQQQQVKQQQNSSDLGEQMPVRELSDLERKLKSSQSFYPLPSQLREQVAQQNETTQKATTNLTQQQQQQQQDQLTKLRYQDFAEAKFSISDVKRQQNQQQQFTSIQSTLNPIYSTTKVPVQSTQYSNFASQSTKSSKPLRDQEPGYGQDFNSFANLPNGTPLGGDYLESLDDFPRGLVQQQQQRQRSEKQKLESDAKAEQAGGEPLSAMASELVPGPHYLPMQESHSLYQQHPPPAQQPPQPKQPPAIADQSRYIKVDKQPPPVASPPSPPPQQPIKSPLPLITPEITRPEMPVKSKQNFELEQTTFGETKSAPVSPPKGQQQQQQPTPTGPLRSPAAILLAGNKTVPPVQQQTQVQVPVSEPAPIKSTSIEQMIDEELRQIEKIEQQQQQQQQQQHQSALNVAEKSLAYLPDGNQQAAHIPEFQQQQQQHEQQQQPQTAAGPMISSKLYNKEKHAPMPPTHQLPQQHHHQHHYHNQQQQQHDHHEHHQQEQQLQEPQQHAQHQPPQHHELAHYGQAPVRPAERPHENDQPPVQQIDEHSVQQQPQINAYERQPKHFNHHHQQQQQPQQQPKQQHHEIPSAHQNDADHQQYHSQQQAPPKSRPPKIVSYNYFESPNEPSGGESTYGNDQNHHDHHDHHHQHQHQHEQPHETNFQFGDTLLSSSGHVEHQLSQHELEAIQKQFLTAEHPVVPLADHHNHHQAGQAGANAYNEHHERQQHGQQQVAAHAQRALEQDLSRLLANHQKSSDRSQKLNSNRQYGDQPVEYMKEGASSIEESAVARPAEQSDYASPFEGQPDMKLTHHVRSMPSQDQYDNKSSAATEKKKSLIVYLNHPRPSDMSKAADSSEDNLAQLISEQTTGDPFVSAKEFDSHGLSKDTKHLDVSSLRGLGVEAKDVPDKDGLSVVVIGDAYKYKKIVLLISSKSGGLKFIPMVKDMKKK